MKLTPDTQLMLQTIAKSAGTTDEEMLNALVMFAYNKPHFEWETLLKQWRNRQR